MCVCGVFVWFWYQGNGGLVEWIWEHSLLFNFLEYFEENKYKFFFICLVEFSCKAIWSWIFVCGSFFITNSISLLVISLFIVSDHCGLIDFLSGWSVHWCQCGVKVPYYNCIIVSFSLYVCWYLPYILRCSYIGCAYVNECNILFLHESLYHYIMPFFVFCYRFCFKIYFVDMSIANPTFL